MNKKGYTLVELIAVVVIIALISIIVILNFDTIIGKSNNKKDKAFKDDLEKAACVFIDLKANAVFKQSCYPSKTCTVRVSQLISAGLITDEYTDPATNKAIDPQLSVVVSWDDNGTKTCTFNR